MDDQDAFGFGGSVEGSAMDAFAAAPDGAVVGGDELGDDSGEFAGMDGQVGFGEAGGAEDFGSAAEPSGDAGFGLMQEPVDQYAGIGGGMADDGESKDAIGENKLVEFRLRFEQEVEEKKDVEKAAKATRRDAAANALAEHFAMKDVQLQKKKESNREAERQKEAEMEQALEGESWARVASMVELTRTDGASTGPDVTRMKDVLIQLKSQPLPALAGGM